MSALYEDCPHCYDGAAPGPFGLGVVPCEKCGGRGVVALPLTVADFERIVEEHRLRTAALKDALPTLVTAIEAGCRGMRKEIVRDAIANHSTLKLMRAALAAPSSPPPALPWERLRELEAALRAVLALRDLDPTEAWRQCRRLADRALPAAAPPAETGMKKE